jgi:hypothetical protein
LKVSGRAVCAPPFGLEDLLAGWLLASAPIVRTQNTTRFTAQKPLMRLLIDKASGSPVEKEWLGGFTQNSLIGESLSQFKTKS